MKNIRSYILGFIFSLGLTLCAFLLFELHAVTQHMFLSHQQLGIAALLLAVAQLLVQLVFFLHLGRERKSHWNVIVFGFTLFIVVVIVGGSLWIMDNLEHSPFSRTPFIENVISPEMQRD